MLNGLLFLALFTAGSNVIGYFIAIPATAIFITMSGVWHAVWYYLDQRFTFNNILRCVGYIIPISAVVILSMLGISAPRKTNQQRPAISKDGEHRAYVLAQSPGWSVEIQNANGNTEHEEQTEFLSRFNVYWVWDTDGRLWLYNSDDGRVHCWQSTLDNQWEHIVWGYGHTRKTEATMASPPEDLYPDYARRNLTEPSDSRKPPSDAF